MQNTASIHEVKSLDMIAMNDYFFVASSELQPQHDKKATATHHHQQDFRFLQDFDNFLAGSLED
jgi:hypothetical protein